ncbi:unnamed protein product [Brachionus calyciflorus]|uniref:RING-type domain-containing protein n=1 Tax=Brachionus calyciflorus TaxID=104777 RepID=A0A813MI26_9BILA|nr:unnamed protein product [Brachionus calyciflorus]
MVKFTFFEKLFKSEKSSLVTETEYLDSKDESKLINLINEGFTCGCCLQVLRRPVTLVCGHSFCQLCLAQWYLTSSNKICPTCRQEWTEAPKINYILKSSIQIVVKHELTQPHSCLTLESLNDYLKKSEILTLEETETIKKYEEKSRDNKFYKIFSSTILFIRFLLVGLSLGIYIGVIFLSVTWIFTNVLTFSINIIENRKSDFVPSLSELRKKYTVKVEEWTTDNVEEWLIQLGPWTSDFLSSARELEIDGQKLINLNHSILQSPYFDIQHDEVRNLLLNSIKILKRCHLKSTDFWENANKFQVVINSFIYQVFPRLTILYYYIFEEHTFKTFAKLAYKNIHDLNEKDIINLYPSYLNQNINQTQKDDCEQQNKYTDAKKNKISLFSLCYLLLFPYFAQKHVFNLLFYVSNKPTSLFVSANCIISTIFDIILIIDLINLTT